MKTQTATKAQFVIRIPRGIISGYSSRHDTVQTVHPEYQVAEWAKLFATRKAAEKFIAKYAMENASIEVL